jgi:hypothetical protein
LLVQLFVPAELLRELIPLAELEVIRAADHFQTGWKSNNHFQRLASGRADAVASKIMNPLPS